MQEPMFMNAKEEAGLDSPSQWLDNYLDHPACLPLDEFPGNISDTELNSIDNEVTLDVASVKNEDDDPLIGGSIVANAEIDFIDNYRLVHQDKSSHPPVNDNYSGELKFEIEIDGSKTMQKKYLFSHLLQRIYVDMGRNFPVQFRWDFNRTVIPLRVRATTVFSEPAQAHQKVTRCLQHQHYHDSSNADFDDAVRYHVLRSSQNPNANGVIYCEDPSNSFLSVLVEYPIAPPAGARAFTHAYKFVCKSSCNSGINRRPIEIIFTLEDSSGNIYGRQTVGAKVCSCPARDMRKDDETEGKTRGKKRLVGTTNHPPGPNKRPRTEGREDNNVYKLPKDLEIVGKKTYEAGLTLFLNYMKASRSESTTPNQYNKGINQLQLLLDQVKDRA